MMENKVDALNPRVGIHTVCIRSKQRSVIRPEENTWIRSEEHQAPPKPEWWKYVLNLNHPYCGKDVWSLKEFEQLLQCATQEMGLKEWEFVRVDLRFDEYKCEYVDYLKLERLLILLFAQQYHIKDHGLYESKGIKSRITKTIRAQSGTLEAEYYNKRDEHPGHPAKSRLELRTKKAYDYARNDLDLLLIAWENRLMASTSSQAAFERLQADCNAKLVKKYEEDKHLKRIRSFYDFVRLEGDTIFTRHQLIELLKMLGDPNPVKKADNIKSQVRPEFFRLAEVKRLVDILMNSLNCFIEGSQAKAETLEFKGFGPVEEVKKQRNILII